MVESPTSSRTSPISSQAETMTQRAHRRPRRDHRRALDAQWHHQGFVVGCVLADQVDVGERGDDDGAGLAEFDVDEVFACS